MRTTKIRAQFSSQTTQNLLRVNDQNLVLWAIDENMGTNLQAFYKHFYISCLKTQKQQFNYKLIFFFLNSGTARLNRAGRKPVRAGRSALRNRPSWNTDYMTVYAVHTRVVLLHIPSGMHLHPLMLMLYITLYPGSS